MKIFREERKPIHRLALGLCTPPLIATTPIADIRRRSHHRNIIHDVVPTGFTGKRREMSSPLRNINEKSRSLMRRLLWEGVVVFHSFHFCVITCWSGFYRCSFVAGIWFSYSRNKWWIKWLVDILFPHDNPYLKCCTEDIFTAIPSKPNSMRRNGIKMQEEINLMLFVSSVYAIKLKKKPNYILISTPPSHIWYITKKWYFCFYT